MVSLPEGVIEYLRGCFRSIWPRPASRLFHGASPDEPVSEWSLHHAFEKARERVGIASCHSFHSPRHSAATHLLKRGGNIETIRDALGHRSADTTRGYARATGRMFAALNHPLSGFPVLRG